MPLLLERFVRLESGQKIVLIVSIPIIKIRNSTVTNNTQETKERFWSYLYFIFDYSIYLPKQIISSSKAIPFFIYVTKSALVQRAASIVTIHNNKIRKFTYK